MPLHQRTPGEIYRMINEQFRARRGAGHETCLLPAVLWDAREGNGWALDPAAPCCNECRALAGVIARGYVQRFSIGLAHRAAKRAASACANEACIAA